MPDMNRPPQPPGRVSDPAWADTLGFLLERKARGVELGVGRMQRFAEALGNPHRAIPCIHVAGTNGKGSVAAMLESVLRAAGWRTGLYTSPHLVQLGERVQVDRIPLTHEELSSYVTELRPVVEELERKSGREAGPSYFEFMTGLAFHHFARRQCDLAVIEVGMGGRRDATNIVIPEVSIITSIGLDHCELLGGSLAAIATEKAGIIKPGRPVVVGRVPPEAAEVIRMVATEQRTNLEFVQVALGEDLAAYPRTNLPGEYQRWNAGTAALAARRLPARWRVTDALVASALMQVAWPARWERATAGDREVVIDSSHNPEGATVLDANLRALVAETKRAPVAVVGALGEARARAILAVVARHAREIHLVAPEQPRACPVAQLRALVPAAFKGRVYDGSVETLFPAAGCCTAGVAGDAVVVTGSIYLAGEVLARLRPENGPAEPRLQDF